MPLAASLMTMVMSMVLVVLAVVMVVMRAEMGSDRRHELMAMAVC